MSTGALGPRQTGDRTKLAKWAQQELTRLERRVEQLETALRGQQTATDTWMDTYDEATSVALPPGSRIHFHLDGPAPMRAKFDGHYFEARIRRDGYNGEPYLDVSTSSGMPTVVPQASNVIRILHTDRW